MTSEANPWTAAWRLLPEYLSEHVVLSACALVLGLLISLPLTVLAVRCPRVRWPVLAFASVIQTIPSLALLALFYPLLLALSALTQQLWGGSFSALGFLPSLLALTLYSMLPIIRNGVTAIVNLPAPIVEAARGVGMTDSQRLWRIELPLATPMLMAGVRTAAVWVIGAATLSTPVGQTSLGNYIFSGLQVENWVSVLFGCLAAALLALIVDQLLGLVESGTARRSPLRIVAGVCLLAAGFAFAALPRLGGSPTSYVIGAKNFSEQYILADLIAQRLERAGHASIQKTGLGSVIAFRALARDELDVYVDYSGTLWANVMRRTDTPSREAVLDELTAWLEREHGIALLGSLGFENAYALAMRRDRAAALGIRTIDDLARQAGTLRMGSDLEFFERPEWRALQAAYGLTFAARRQFQPTFMYKAVRDGEVDVISAFSSDGRVAADNLVVLEDPRQAILPYDAVVLLSPARAGDSILRQTLAPLIGTIDIELMREANLEVDQEVGKIPPGEAALRLDARLRNATPRR